MTMVMQLLEQVFGLNIVKNIIDLHKGTIEVNSVVNKGTKTTIRIPTNFAEMNSK